MTYKIGLCMLEPVLGSVNRERVLVFLFARREGYARQIAAHFDTDLDPVQKQLYRLALGGVLVSRKVGRTRLYSFSPRYPFLRELEALLEKALAFYPSGERDRLLLIRRRPRRRGKPL